MYVHLCACEWLAHVLMRACMERACVRVCVCVCVFAHMLARTLRLAAGFDDLKHPICHIILLSPRLPQQLTEVDRSPSWQNLWPFCKRRGCRASGTTMRLTLSYGAGTPSNTFMRSRAAAPRAVLWGTILQVRGTRRLSQRVHVQDNTNSLLMCMLLKKEETGQLYR